MEVEDPYSREAGSIVARMQGANDFLDDIDKKLKYAAETVISSRDALAAAAEEEQEDQPE